MKYHTLFSSLFLSAVANLSHATLIHQYDFNGNMNDSLGGRSLNVFGQGTYNDNSTYTFRNGQGFELNEKIGAVYTLDLVFQLSKIGDDSKVLDFTNLQGNGGLYAEPSFKGYYLDGRAAYFGQLLALNQPTRLTWVRDAGGNVSIYQDGILGYSFVDKINFYVYTKNPVFFFVTDNYYRDFNGVASGSVDSIRIYNNALTADQINLPPPEPQPETSPSILPSRVPEPASVAIFGAGLGLIGLVRRRRSRSLRG